MLFAVCTTAVAAGSAQDKQRPPNIVLIVSDDLGYQDISPFGGEEVTPHLARLAREGVIGTSFYMTAPGCTPSRSSILTGRYPQRNGMYDMIRNDMVNYGHRFTEIEYRRQPESTLGMDVRERTLADMLKKAHYVSGIFGKWDGGRARRYLPLQRGFDEFLGIVNTGTDYWTHERYGMPSLYRNNELVHEEGFLVELEGREAARFVRDNHHRPFFLYFPSFGPHGASNLERSGIRPPQKYLDLYPGRDPKDNRTEYMATVSAVDAQVGTILDLLDQYGIAENTLVIFHSDNGGPRGNKSPGDNGPLRGGKGNLWEGGIRSPFIARWPGTIPAGTKTDALLSTLELMPTLAAVAKTWVPDATMDGFDMLPVLQGQEPSSRNEMFWNWLGTRAARVGNWKWVDIEGEGGLFDLTKDIGEQHDLSKERPDVLTDVKARWAAWRREMDNADPRGPFRDF
ncbi:MAG: sulfatase-like hydrolase/transferase [Luteitalea sp.]|nr:sulfatase-like hydrolase/transferase [Luteitalea sp.]